MFRRPCSCLFVGLSDCLILPDYLDYLYARLRVQGREDHLVVDFSPIIIIIDGGGGGKVFTVTQASSVQVNDFVNNTRTNTNFKNLSE